MTKPELVGLETSGRHNLDFEGTTTRILQGGSWKKQRIIVLLPSANMISAKVALSHWALIFPPNQGVYRMLCLGMEVGDAYSQAIESILAHPDLREWEYILTIESDNAPPQDGVIKLLAAMEQHPEFACIGGTYWTKGEGGVCQRWGDVNDPVLNFRPQPPPTPGELGECAGTGMGFNLWRVSMFRDEKLKRPWFKTVASAEEGFGTQDLAFWSDARKYGYRCAIHGGVLVGHYDASADIMW